MHALTDELFDLFNGKNLKDKQHEAFMLLTVSEDVCPHTAMVSVGEVVATDHNTLRLALWPESQTTQNIVRSGKAMLVLFYNSKAVYITLSLEPLATLKEAKFPRARFVAKVVHCREDVAKYAEITSGVKINLKDSDDVLARWQATIQELLL
ncbi:hypothetical protein JOD43_000954 [Pullulanibacillus pueri]|uniref:Pyridoxamine 5'-phosphate oxidase family protein n=1 Tax=Pullulanibacillus pueri TaxID=1437324 RepID=A0A8J2ZUH3_9BACL|nr:pyridoxamine 5'-phosphate oxidase family protein [Pullulanibacillus pueri]MBM7680790.1 hypothetical protein [Pullulanibacillus pueri]GGH78343.1 hypothetical protein GCM10007096_11620 [Pullulanibacillus pueri]